MIEALNADIARQVLSRQGWFDEKIDMIRNA
jgi:hypothetical protein